MINYTYKKFSRKLTCGASDLAFLFYSFLFFRGVFFVVSIVPSPCNNFPKTNQDLENSFALYILESRTRTTKTLSVKSIKQKHKIKEYFGLGTWSLLVLGLTFFSREKNFQVIAKC